MRKSAINWPFVAEIFLSIAVVVAFFTMLAVCVADWKGQEASRWDVIDKLERGR